MPRLLDLFCGRFGWSKPFAARSWECVGVDLVEPPEIPDGCSFVKADILSLRYNAKIGFYIVDGPILGLFDFICASSPCEEFSVFQIRNFHPNPKYPDTGIMLFDHTREICFASGTPYVQENVRAAQQFIGYATAHAGSFYLWGNAIPPLLHTGLTKGMKMDRAWCQKLGGHGTKQRDAQTAGFATIPPELANCVCDYAERLIEQRCKEQPVLQCQS